MTRSLMLVYLYSIIIRKQMNNHNAPDPTNHLP